MFFYYSMIRQGNRQESYNSIENPGLLAGTFAARTKPRKNPKLHKPNITAHLNDKIKGWTTKVSYIRIVLKLVLNLKTN